MARRTIRAAIAAVAVLALAAPAAGAAWDAASEPANFSKTTERFRLITSAPRYQAKLRAEGLDRMRRRAEIIAADGPARQYGRDFAGNLCQERTDGCAGDVRLYDWAAEGGGIVQPVLFTARNGSTLSGHVWATAAGPRRRPAVVITNGSIQAPEELYWYAATSLAKAGFVVLTWDPQGQGYSDTFGDGADQQDGVPSQSGRPFFDGTEDALDFLLSTPRAPYVPRPSCTSGASHADKQRARVADRRSSAFNPFWSLVDPSRIGLVGHSLGAAAVSYVGQLDPRVDAIVALDNLGDVTTDGASFSGQPITCDSGSSPRPATLVPSKPALGISNDYGLLPQPNLTAPDPDGRTVASRALSAAGVDSGEIVIRGGTHYEHSFIPNPGFGATLRGMDVSAWYALAWLERYVKGDPGATARLLSDRWLDDPPGRAADPGGDGNLYSYTFRSRLDIARGPGRVTCEDLREGCAALAPDGRPVPFDALAYASTPDGPGPGTALGPSRQGAPGSVGNEPGGLP
jgi:hypothetical protein